MRAPFNVLVLPYYKQKNEVLYCIFKRSDSNIWQFIAGGGEDEEDYLSAAKREAKEEANISSNYQYLKLESMCYVSVDNFSEKARATWGKRFVIPVYAFAVGVSLEDIKISTEHTAYEWHKYEDARKLLYFDLDKTSLYELNAILTENNH